MARQLATAEAEKKRKEEIAVKKEKQKKGVIKKKPLGAEESSKTSSIRSRVDHQLFTLSYGNSSKTNEDICHAETDDDEIFNALFSENEVRTISRKYCERNGKNPGKNNADDSSGPGSRGKKSLKKQRIDNDIPPTELELLQHHLDDETSYPFDISAYRANSSLRLQSLVRDESSGACALMQSLLLSTSIKNEALDEIYFESFPPVDAWSSNFRELRSGEIVGRLDKYNQRALVFSLYNWIHPLGSSEYEGHASKAKLQLTVPIIQEVIMKAPRNIEQFSQCCSSLCSPVFLVENRELLIEMCNIVNDFCVSRVIPSTLLRGLSSSDEVPLKTLPSQLNKRHVHACTIEDLRALRARIPLTNYAFSVAAKLTYEKLAGSRSNFEGHGGGRGCKGAEIEGDTIYQYGGMNENFIQEMCERLCIGKQDTFVDVGSGIGQVALQVAATTGEILALRVCYSQHIYALTHACKIYTHICTYMYLCMYMFSLSLFLSFSLSLLFTFISHLHDVNL